MKNRDQILGKHISVVMGKQLKYIQPDINNI
jgi:hypothetical protein